MRAYFIQAFAAVLLACSLSHLLMPSWTDRVMAQQKYVRAAGVMLLVLIAPSLALGLYLLAFMLAAFGLPRVIGPERSIRLQQRLYPRRVHGVLLLAAAAALWLASLRLP
jgi:hypothetical protein